MNYKVELDFLDFRKNKHWDHDDTDTNELNDDIKDELLFQLDQLDSGILNQQDEQFIIFAENFQDLCSQYQDDLYKIIEERYTMLFLESLTDFYSIDFKIQLLNILYTLTVDDHIKHFLYENDIINILFQLYHDIEDFFTPICNIFSSYFINTDDETHQQILKYKCEYEKEDHKSIPKTTSFFNVLIRYTDPDNSEYAHSALFLLSVIINNSKISEKDINLINDSLIKRLNSNPQEEDLDDIIYCFCSLIRQYPQNIFLFSKIQIIWKFPYIFDKTQDENEFIAYLIFLQHLLSHDGQHIVYFDMPYIKILFSKIIERISNCSELSEASVIAALKALYFGISQIPSLIPITIQDGILDLLQNIHEQYQFSIREISLHLLNKILEKSDEKSYLIIINSQIILDILNLIDQFSIEFISPFFENLTKPLSNIENEKLELCSEVVCAVQELASSENELISEYAQNFLTKLPS